MCSYLMLEINSFVSLKNKSFLFLDEGTFQEAGGGEGRGRVKFSKILSGGC